MESETKIEGFKLDVLREVANIGAGHAASALSQIMTNCRVMISVPDVKALRSDALLKLFGGPDTVIVAALMRILGDLPGRTALVMSEESAKLLCDFMIGRAPGTTTELEELERSTLAEAGNILGSAYLNALSDLLDMMLLPSVPTLVIDKPANLAAQLDLETEQTVLCASTAFKFPDREPERTLNGQFLHLPEPASFKALFEAIDR